MCHFSRSILLSTKYIAFLFFRWGCPWPSLSQPEGWGRAAEAHDAAGEKLRSLEVGDELPDISALPKAPTSSSLFRSSQTIAHSS
jgi:hypothetical protein